MHKKEFWVLSMVACLVLAVPALATHKDGAPHGKPDGGDVAKYDVVMRGAVSGDSIDDWLKGSGGGSRLTSIVPMFTPPPALMS